jgi:non-haem Fe2+, alpha-ketoglutarate-dependent halogenase
MTVPTSAETFELSPEELASFRVNGYIGPVTIYSPEEMEQLWRRIHRETLDRSHAAYPDTGAGAGAPNIHNYDRHLDIDLLAEHIMNRRIIDRVTSILGDDVLCWRSEFFPKYPGDEGTDWHQADTFANASGKPQLLWPGESETVFGKGTLTVWTAFTDSTLENGALQIIPGSQHEMNYDESSGMKFDSDRINNMVKEGTPRGFFGYDYRELQKDPNWKPDEDNAVALTMKKGQCVIFWSTLMHASLPNTSTGKNYRMGFASRYVPASVRIYPDTEHIEEYGGAIPLDKWAAVLVNGEDRYGHNKVTSTTLRGTPIGSASAS